MKDSLPPYDVLDRILKLYIEDLKSPQEIADRYGFDLQLVKDIALHVDRNEYKRSNLHRAEDYVAGFRIWPAVSHRAEVYSIRGRGPR